MLGRLEFGVFPLFSFSPFLPFNFLHPSDSLCPTPRARIGGMNDELLLDLATAAPWLCHAPRRVPGPLSVIWCRQTLAGGLMFAWQRPRGMVDGYRLERTRDGKKYELLAETESEGVSLPPVAKNQPWIYRVTAFNCQGQGLAPWMYFYLRRHKPLLLRVPVHRPALRVVINELVTE